MTGKRHPYSCDYKIGLVDNLQILSYEATFFQNGGAAADLSPAVLERTLFHANNSYYIPNVTVTAHCCKTHLPPNTAFRGFGGPQGMVVIEAAIHHAAQQLGVSAHEIQEKNLLYDGCEFPYGQIASEARARDCWEEAVRTYALDTLENEISHFNQTHDFVKKGLSLMPICFGISFTNTQMNQARALVHVYGDGSIGVSTGAVEMGQGVNAKLLKVAADRFGVSASRVKIETTNTTRVANTSPSAASSTTDLNGKALIDACDQVLARLKDLIKASLHTQDAIITIENEHVYVNGQESELTWNAVIQEAIAHRISLSAKGHYATPEIHFDKQIEKGHPFAYHVYGTGLVISRVDCLRGTYDIERVALIHDCGDSMHMPIDLGQIEGGLVQGIGWMTLEELKYNSEGVLLSGTLATYKIPGVYSTPHQIDVGMLNKEGSEFAIQKSKAVGEPPLMYGIGAYFSLFNAILAFNPKAELNYQTPMTPERVLMSLYRSGEMPPKHQSTT
jgi:xanthine dehydrogenase large subunit